MHPYNLNPGSDSLQYLQVAENLLKARDLTGAKSFALKAQESDPNLEAADQILAIVDTLIAGDKQISGNNLDWYSILQLARRTHDSELIGSQYKRLSRLLNPNRNRYAYAEHAYKLVTEAWMVLSNPSRKFQFDNEFGNSNATHFNFIQTRFEGSGSEMQQRNQLIRGGSSGGLFEGSEMQQGRNKVIGGSSGLFEGSEMQQRNKVIGGSSGSSGLFEGSEMQQGRNKVTSGSSGLFEGLEMQQGRNKVIGGSSGSSGLFEGSEMQQGRNKVTSGSNGLFEGLEMQQGRNKVVGGSSGSSGLFEGLEMQRNQLIGGSSGQGTEMQQRNKQIGGSSGVHFDFMQEGSGGELQQSSPMQFVQQQQGFVPQALPFFGEDERQQDGPILTSQLHWSNQGKQPMVRAQPQQELVRPQPQQQLVRPQPQQQLARPQPQQPLLRPHSEQAWFQQPGLQAHMLQPQPHQPSSHWAQSQSQPKTPPPEPREQPTQPLHWAQHVTQQLPPLSEPQPQSWMQQALPRPHIRQSSTEPRPSLKSREQPRQPLGSSRQVPLLPSDSREEPQQPLHSPQQVPWPLLKPREQPPQPLHSSQPVPQIPPFSQPQPWMQESLPIPQIQTSLPEPQSQPEKTLPESRESLNNGEHFNFGENGDNPDNNVNVEEPASFWTACPYCYHMYEYAGIYVDCTLRCQDCRKAFHAARIEAPPTVADGEDAYICCWGYFPIGVSMSELEKRKADASNWQPFSKMYAVPRGGNAFASQGGNTCKRKKPWNSGPRIYIDDNVEDVFDDIPSNDETDDDCDWRRARKNKKTKRYRRRKVSTAKKVQQPQALGEMVQDSNAGNLDSGVVAQDGSVVGVPDDAVPVVPEAAVPVVPEAAVPVVPEVTEPNGPVPKAVMDDADKNVGETSEKKVSFSIRKQPGRAAKDSGKLDRVEGQEGQSVGVPDVPAPVVSVSVAAPIVAVEGSSKRRAAVPTRKQPGRVAKDMGS